MQRSHVRVPSSLQSRTDAPGAVRRGVADAIESALRVIRGTRMPTPTSLLAFFRHQLFVNAVSWTAGLLAAGLVRHLFEVKGLRNLWGLASSGSRVLVSSDEYRVIMTGMSFAAGLSMMIFARHFLLRWIEEIRALRRERRAGVEVGVAVGAAGQASGALPGFDLEAFEPEDAT